MFSAIPDLYGRVLRPGYEAIIHRDVLYMISCILDLDEYLRIGCTLGNVTQQIEPVPLDVSICHTGASQRDVTALDSDVQFLAGVQVLEQCIATRTSSYLAPCHPGP